MHKTNCRYRSVNLHLSVQIIVIIALKKVNLLFVFIFVLIKIPTERPMVDPQGAIIQFLVFQFILY